jgi:hypothetical protein
MLNVKIRTLEEFMLTSERASRAEFVQNVKVWQAQQTYPKRLKVERVSGTCICVKCEDVDCGMCVEGRCKADRSWAVSNCNASHNVNCLNAGQLQPNIIAARFINQPVLAQNLTTKEVLTSLKAFNCSVGGNSRGTDVSGAARLGVTRAKAAAKKLNKGGYDLKLQQIECLMTVYKTQNPGSLTDIEFYDDGTLRRLYIISQVAVSVWTSGFARRIVSLDGGFWKEAHGKKYKLIVFVCTTGNNNNQTLIWVIADGEKADNISYAIDALREAGIVVNDAEVATISDEGAAIWKALRDSALLAFHMLCKIHWLDNSKGWGKGGSLFEALVCAKTQAQYDTALKEAEQKCPVALTKLLGVTPQSALVRYPRLQGQEEGTLPATFGRVMSFCEQEQNRYVKERKLHPTDSVVEYTAHASISYATQVETVRKIIREIPEEERFLTPAAITHWEEAKNQARSVTVKIIHFESGLFSTCSDGGRTHRTNFTTRECSDCHCYAENLQPCHHLVAIYMHYKNIGAQDEHYRLFIMEGGEKKYISTYIDALSHLYGRCYYMRSMIAAYDIRNCTAVVPVSYDEASAASTCRTLLKPPKNKAGRPKTKRINSKFDPCGQGTRPPVGAPDLELDLTTNSAQQMEAAATLLTLLNEISSSTIIM